MIPVTKPFLPPKEIFDEFVDQIWDRNWLTNNGPMVNKLEQDLRNYLGVDNLLFTGNGTIALQIAIQAMGLKGEIITTPFSYVATTTAIIWEGCTPIFADIDKERLTIDPTKIEELITDKTEAILATHVYGIPCHVEEIDAIANKYKLKIIYDAAHAFGVKFRGSSVLNYGDISTLSTHATKLFHTIEGGAVVTRHPEWLHQLVMMRNFGHNGPERFDAVGINGKNSEFHAAMGLANLSQIQAILTNRKEQYLYYENELNNLNLQFLSIPDSVDFNYSYCPIIFPSEEILLKVISELEKNQISGRRYFYPTLNSLDYIEKRGHTPVADSVSKKILCLPMYFTLTLDEQSKIISVIKRVLS